MNVTHREARLGDANRLFDVRKQAIIVLAGRTMLTADAKNWATTLTVDGMRRKLRELDVRIAEVGGTVVGWGGIRGNRLEGLYTDPAFAFQGIGTMLLFLLETLMRERAFAFSNADASLNALQFYLRRGYALSGPPTPEAAQPIRKRLFA
jgi:putative acetyltransferase